ncbi:SIMPL domain-containing protein [Neobacillus sp. NPDC058068]|uniref:SIMPL domain-containing protein n=1 Tax=Neobacillus sp. NPDC058068 TaxID=3346325 RepID=UPI0036D99F5B
MYNYQPPIRNGHPSKGHSLIKVTGDGELAVQPDTASVNLGVVTENKVLKTAQQRNSQESKRVIDSLLALGIPHSHVQTFDYRIESDYDYEQGKQIFRGYKITHIVQVKIENLTIIGKVVDTGVENGVNYVSNIQFKVKNKDSYYQQSLTLAINNALEKAKTIAAALNVTLVPTPSLVIEGGAVAQPFYHQPETLVKGISSTQFEPGQILIKANIVAEFHYLPTY